MQSGAIAQSCITETVATLVAPSLPAVSGKTSEPYEAPENFLAFRERYMRPGSNYIRCYLERRKVPPHELEDTEAEMVLLFCTPVGGSGLVDRIAYYNRDKQAGAASTQGHFLKFIRGIMSNKLSNLRKKAKRDAATNDRALQHNAFDSRMSPVGGAYEPEIEPQSDIVSHTTRREAQSSFMAMNWEMDVRLEMSSFKSYLRRVKPRLLVPLDLFSDFDTTKEVAQAAGVTTTTARAWRQAIAAEFIKFSGRKTTL